MRGGVVSVKKKKLSKGQIKYIEEFVTKKLESRSLKSWQQACESLAPPNYDNTTRSAWFEENKYRATAGREIVEFVEEACKALQRTAMLSNVLVSEIRSGIVKGIRKAESAQSITKYLLNDVKLAALRTIVGWIDHPYRLDEVNATAQERTRQKSRRGRKAEKGKYRPPELNLIKEWEVIDKTTIRITSLFMNSYLHPYQNVEVEIDVDPKLILTNVSPYSWLPEDSMIRVGYLPAELGIEPSETEFVLDLSVRKWAPSYRFSWKVYCDNCEKGIRDVSEKGKATIKYAR